MRTPRVLNPAKNAELNAVIRHSVTFAFKSEYSLFIDGVYLDSADCEIRRSLTCKTKRLITHELTLTTTVQLDGPDNVTYVRGGGGCRVVEF